MSHKWIAAAAAVLSLLAVAAPTAADLMLVWDGGNGLSAQANLRLVDAQTLEVMLTNTSTGIPPGLASSAANQLLTSVSFNLGQGVNIIGGSAILGSDGQTVNFDPSSTA